jgi:type IV pilus assembly protein PilQ
LDYRLTNTSPTKLKIYLINAEIPKRHQKPLRTDLFSTSVEMIVPGSQTIFVQLKDAVPHQVQKKKGVLMIDFPPPRFAMTSDQKAVSTGDQQRREGVEKGVRAAQARKEAARILKEEQLRLQSETRERQIRNLLKEQDDIRQEMREIERKYRVTPDPEVFSKPITMDFQGISLKNAFRLLAEQAGINIIVGPQVEGSVTMRLFHVPLGQVIDQILKTNELDRELIGNVMWIGKLDEIKESKEARSKQYEVELRRTRRKLERNKSEIKKLEKEREKGLEELRKMEARGEEEAPEEITSVETIGETQKIEIEGEAVTFVLVRIKLSYATPSKIKPVLECVFNQKCEGITTAASQAVADKRAERKAARDLEKQGFQPGWGGTNTRLERLRREQRAERRVRAQEQMAAGGEAPGEATGVGLAGGLDSRMEKILAYTIIWANDEYGMLFIKDLPERIEEMKKLIASMDIPKPQVLIESRLVQADRAWGRGLGIVWGGANNQIGRLLGNSKNAVWGVTGGYTAGLNNPSYSDTGTINNETCTARCGRSPVGDGDILSTPVVNLPATVTGLDNLLGLGVQFGLIGNNFATDLDVRLQLGEANSKAKVIGRPKVQVLDGETAEIKNGRQIAYSSVSADGTQVQLVSVDLKLEVTPKIFPDGRIQMDIAVSDNDVGDVVNGLASILTREAETTMIVMDGETAVIGGILRKTDNVGHQGWPGLMHVPVLNYLFGSKNRAKRVTELLVFITPTIVKRPPSAS